MTRLPNPGGDDGTWGDILNAYLEVVHNADGSLKNNTVGTNQLQSGSVTNAQLDTSTQAALTKASSSVQSVNSKTPTNGDVTLSASDVSAIPTSQLGAASGVATLNSSSQLTSSQLPSSVVTAIAPSGDTTGVTDRTAINAALAAGKRVLGVPGGSYYVDQPIKPITGSVLDMTGCTITNQTPTGSILENSAAATPFATASDASTTSGSATFTSATLTAAGVRTGDTVQVQGASYGGSAWYGVVTVSGSNITMNGANKAQVTLANATCYIWRTRNTDITIIGGYWTEQWVTSTNSMFHIRRVDRLTVRDITVGGTGPYAGSNHLSLHCGDITQFLFDNIHFDEPLSDGLHIMGPANMGMVRNLSGYTHDDMWALSTADGFNPTIYDCQGSVSNITYDGIYPNGCYCAGHIYDSDTAHMFNIQNITVRSVKGTSTNNGVYLNTGGTGTGSNVSGLVIDDISLSPGIGFPAVYVGSYQAADVFISNVTWESSSPATAGIVSVSYIAQNVRIKNVRLATSPAGTNIGVKLSNSGTSQTISVEGVQHFIAPATFIPVQLAGGSSAIAHLIVRDIYNATAGPTIQFSSATSITNLHLQNIVASNTTGISIPASNPAVTIRASNVQFSGTNFLATSSPVTLEAVNFDVNTSGAIVKATGAGATPVVVTLANYTQAGAGAVASKDGTQTVTTNVANYTTASV